MFELYSDPRTRYNLNDTTIYRGIATTEVDIANKLIKRSYAVNGLNKWGKPHLFDVDSLEFYYQRERDMLQHINSIGYENAPELIEFNNTSRTIITKYYGESLRVTTRLAFESGVNNADNPLLAFPDVKDKIINAFRRQKELGIVKYNFHPVNLVICEETGKLISFDWKSSELPNTSLDSTAENTFVFASIPAKKPIAPAALSVLNELHGLIKTVGDLERASITSHWTEFDPSLVDVLNGFIQ
jgi:hypothetical protein